MTMSRDEARILISDLIEWYTEDVGERLGLSMCKETYMDALEVLWHGPEGDLISRADAIEAVVAWTVEDRPTEEMPTDLVDRLKALPSADAEQVTSKLESAEAVQGEWKRIEINGYQYAVCDQCNLLADMVEKDGKLVMSMANADYEYANFCPNCGAKMKGGDSE